ncbi:MAG: NAD(P)-dependent oxidoreductase [Treponema sp.]|nr:NAD(P)-dependent oxidoreductase [Treponema sp.]
MKKIAVTGATGMIGSALVRCAAENGIEVLCIVRKESGRLENLPKSQLVKTVLCGINEYPELEVHDNYDVFFHLAWEKTFVALRDDTETQSGNIKYTLDAARLAKRLGCRKFVGAGSQAEYGIVAEPLKPETPVNPQSGYGIAKYAAGKLSRLLCSQLEMEFNWVRILSAYGPFDGDKTLIMYAVNELRSGRSPEFTKCEQIWDYIYCDDAAKALLSIAEGGKNGKTYPLGSGKKKRLSEYLEIIRDITAPDIQLQFGKKEYYPHQPMYLCADITELSEDTGWKPSVSFEEGIKLLLNTI